MPTQYFIFTDQQIAKTQNATWWEKILGRPKKPEDVTQYLFAMIPSPKDNTVLVIVEQSDYDRLYPLLTTPQKNFVDSNIMQANNPAVIAFYVSLSLAFPKQIGTASLSLGRQAPTRTP